MPTSPPLFVTWPKLPQPDASPPSSARLVKDSCTVMLHKPRRRQHQLGFELGFGLGSSLVLAGLQLGLSETQLNPSQARRIRPDMTGLRADPCGAMMVLWQLRLSP
jgi:hypothetical protein